MSLPTSVKNLRRCRFCLASIVGAMCAGAAFAEVSFAPYAIAPASFATAGVLQVTRGAAQDLVLFGEDEQGRSRFAVYAFDQGDWQAAHAGELPADAVLVDTMAFGDRERLVVFDGQRLSAFGPPDWQPKPLGIDPLATIYRGEPRGVAAVDMGRDVNGDGHDDIVLADFDGFWVVLQDTAGGFAEPIKIPTAPTMNAGLSVSYTVPPTYAFDYDGDGAVDFAVLDKDRLQIFKDARALSPTAEIAVPGGLTDLGTASNQVRSLDGIADYNGDGIVDLSVSASEGDDPMTAYSATHFYFGQRTGGVVAFPGEPDATLETGAFGDVEMQDVDRDGRMDAVVATGEFSVRKIIAALVTRSMSIEMHVYLMGAGGFPAEPNLTRKMKVGQNSDPIGFADVNGDGLFDYLQRTEDGLALYLGERSAARFAKRPAAVDFALPFDGRNPARIETADLDGDAKDDFLLLYGGQSSDGVGVVMSR